MKGNPLKNRIKRKRLELLIAFIGYLIGIGIGLWLIIQMVLFNISK